MASIVCIFCGYFKLDHVRVLFRPKNENQAWITDSFKFKGHLSNNEFVLHTACFQRFIQHCRYEENGVLVDVATGFDKNPRITSEVSRMLYNALTNALTGGSIDSLGYHLRTKYGDVYFAGQPEFDYFDDLPTISCWPRLGDQPVLPSRTPTSLGRIGVLPNELLIHISRLCSPGDALSLRKTCVCLAALLFCDNRHWFKRIHEESSWDEGVDWLKFSVLLQAQEKKRMDHVDYILGQLGKDESFPFLANRSPPHLQKIEAAVCTLTVFNST